MEPQQPQKSPSLARNSSVFYLERELQGTQPSPSLLLRGRIFEHDLNRTLALDHLCQAKRCQPPRRSACDSKHKFFFIPVLRSTRLFLCKNRLKILLAQEPLAAAKATFFSLLPQVDLRSALSMGIFLAGGAVSGSPNPSAPNPSGINGPAGWDVMGDSWKENWVLLLEKAG